MVKHTIACYLKVAIVVIGHGTAEVFGIVVEVLGRVDYSYCYARGHSFWK